MQDELLQRFATLRDDEQAQRRPSSREGLLHRATSGNELLVGTEQVGRRQGRARPIAIGWRAGPRAASRRLGVAVRRASSLAGRRSVRPGVLATGVEWPSPESVARRWVPAGPGRTGTWAGRTGSGVATVEPAPRRRSPRIATGRHPIARIPEARPVGDLGLASRRPRSVERPGNWRPKTWSGRSGPGRPRAE